MKTLVPQIRALGFASPKSADASFRVIKIDDGYSGCSWHFHPEFQLGYVASGSGQRVIGDNVHAIEAGEIILLGPNLPHVWHYECDTQSPSIAAI